MRALEGRNSADERLGIVNLFGGDARGAEANEIGKLPRIARSGGCAGSRRFCAGLFEDGFADASAEIAIGVFGVAIEEREVVESGERLGAGASGEDGLAEFFDVLEAAEHCGGFIGEEEIEDLAHGNLVLVGEILRRSVVVEEAIEDGGEGEHGKFPNGKWQRANSECGVRSAECGADGGAKKLGGL